MCNLEYIKEISKKKNIKKQHSCVCQSAINLYTRTFCAGWQTGNVQQHYFSQLEERDKSERTSNCSTIRSIIRENTTLIIYDNLYEILI